MEEEGVLPTMYCSQWFLTLYAYTLPIEHLLRVWDEFLLEGPKVLFRSATMFVVLTPQHAVLQGVPMIARTHVCCHCALEATLPCLAAFEFPQH